MLRVSLGHAGQVASRSPVGLRRRNLGIFMPYRLNPDYRPARLSHARAYSSVIDSKKDIAMEPERAEHAVISTFDLFSIGGL